jgi:hypothetical protein
MIQSTPPFRPSSPYSSSPPPLAPPLPSPSKKKCYNKGSRKKNPPLKAGPLRGGGGKGRATKEKITFKDRNYFTLDNISKYGNIRLKFAGSYFYLLVTIYSKK